MSFGGAHCTQEKKFLLSEKHQQFFSPLAACCCCCWSYQFLNKKVRYPPLLTHAHIHNIALSSFFLIWQASARGGGQIRQTPNLRGWQIWFERTRGRCCCFWLLLRGGKFHAAQLRRGRASHTRVVEFYLPQQFLLKILYVVLKEKGAWKMFIRSNLHPFHQHVVCSQLFFKATNFEIELLEFSY